MDDYPTTTEPALAEIARLLEIRERCARLCRQGDASDVLPRLAAWAASRLRQLMPATTTTGD